MKKMKAAYKRSAHRKNKQITKSPPDHYTAMAQVHKIDNVFDDMDNLWAEIAQRPRHNKRFKDPTETQRAA